MDLTKTQLLRQLDFTQMEKQWKRNVPCLLVRVATEDNKSYKQYGLRAYSQVCVYLSSPQNLWDFALAKKRKTKSKDFAICMAKVIAYLLPYCS